jgi:hypothetical protein
MFVIPTYAEETEGKVELQAAPLAPALSPLNWDGNVGKYHIRTVSTTSTARPYKFYFDPGDGTGIKNSSYYVNSASYEFGHTYGAISLPFVTYQTPAWIYDQNAISPKRNGTALVRSF